MQAMTAEAKWPINSLSQLCLFREELFPVRSDALLSNSPKRVMLR